MRVLLDVDGVLADTSAAAKALMDSIQPGAYDPAAWDFGTSNLTTLGRTEFWDRFGAPGFCAGLEPYPFACDLVHDLQEKHEVFFVTSPFDSPTWMWERTQWLKYHLGADPEQVVHTSEKHLVRGDYLVDDRPENVFGWLLENRFGWAFMPLHQYNRKAGGHPYLRTIALDEMARLPELIP